MSFSLVSRSTSSTATTAAMPASIQREKGAGASDDRTVHARHPPGGGSAVREGGVELIEERQPAVHPRELEEALLGVYNRAIDHCRPGASFAELDRLVREGIATMGYPEQPTHPICHGVGARAHEPPYAHQAGGGTIEEGMVLAIEPGCYWEGGGGLRVEDNFLITANGAEKLSTFPDGIVRCG